MPELNQVLERMQTTLQERGWNGSTSPTLQPGSTSDDGKAITPAPASREVKSNGQSRPTPTSLPSATKLRDCREGQNQLTMLLAQCFLMQKGYGEKAEDAATRDAGFQWLLADYTIGQIKDAFKKYVSTHADMPAPADIINIINPPPPKIDWPLYIEIKKRLRDGNVFVTNEQKDFCRNCEDIAILRQRGEIENYQSAQRQLQQHFQAIEHME